MYGRCERRLSVRDRLSIEYFRGRLAQVDALPQLVILAIVVGTLTAAVIIGFRLAIDFSLNALLHYLQGKGRWT